MSHLTCSRPAHHPHVTTPCALLSACRCRGTPARGSGGPAENLGGGACTGWPAARQAGPSCSRIQSGLWGGRLWCDASQVSSRYGISSVFFFVCPSILSFWQSGTGSGSRVISPSLTLQSLILGYPSTQHAKAMAWGPFIEQHDGRNPPLATLALLHCMQTNRCCGTLCFSCAGERC